MLTVEMLPAAEGDALWIEYGHSDRPHRILVDGGPAHTYHSLRSRILGLPPGDRRLEAVVVTHIDTDHVDGVILLLQDLQELQLDVGEFWFNGYPQLVPPDTQGPPDAEILGALLDEVAPTKWNASHGGEAVVVPDGRPAGPVTLEGGLQLTVIGPGWTELDELRSHWEAELASENWVAGDRDRALRELAERSRLRRPLPLEPPPLPDELGVADPSLANRSSISLIADYGGASILLTGDAHADVLVRELERVAADRGKDRIAVDALKLPHHGSRKNLTAEVLELVQTSRYLVSSSGAKYGHPHQETIELILDHHAGQRRRPRFDFNYRSPHNEMWADPELAKECRYVASYPTGLRIEL